MRKAIFALPLVLLACPPSPNPPSNDTTYCQAMCDHLGPEGLSCPEGEPVYDSDQPGDAGVPNESCLDFCIISQKNNANLNPLCLSQVPSCDQIEAWRTKVCH